MSASHRFDRLTPDARKVLALAQEEARRFNHHYIGTEHLLLGLARQDEDEQSLAATVLNNLGVELNKVRSAVEFIIGRGDRIVLGEVGLTPRAKQVLKLAFDEARQMNQEHVGPEHLLLGLIREGEGIAAGVLESLGVNVQKVRWATYRALGQPIPAEAEAELDETARAEIIRSFTASSLLFQAAGSPGSALPPMAPFAGPLRRYRPWHLDAAQQERTAIGTGAPSAPAPGTDGKRAAGTLLGWVITNTGGAFTLSLYDGMQSPSALAVISNPVTGACFPFHCLAAQGLTYTLEGTPGSVTVIYDEAEEQAASV